MRTEENYPYDSDEYINVGMLIRDYIRILKKTWILLILLIVGSVGLLYLYNGSKLQEPSYNAIIYYSVECGTSLDTNKNIAKRLANGVSSMIETPDFQQNLAETMEMESIPARVWCLAQATDSSNLFNITLSCTDPELINPIMEAFEEVYPTWAIKSIGNCKLTIMDEAESTGINYSLWSKKKIAGYGLIAACGLWLILATIMILTNRKIHNQAEMYQVIEAECLGTIPEVKKKARKNSKKEPLLISNKNVDTGYLQSIRTSRDIIERQIRKGKKVFLFTSTMAGEGKSLLTVNLAYALAHRGKKVVIIDGDIYRGGISELLSIPEDEQGLADYLCQAANRQINVVKKDKLYVIPSGIRKKEGQSKLNAKTIAGLVDGLKKRADVILIDTPPSGILGDALAFTESVDEAIYIIRSNYASVKDIRKGIQPYYQAGKLGGYILNRVVEAVHDSHGRYGYGYGYGYSRYRYGNYGYHRYGYEYGEKKKQREEESTEETVIMSNDQWNL